MFGPQDRRIIDALSGRVDTLSLRIDAVSARLEAVAAKQMVSETQMAAHQRMFDDFRKDMDDRNTLTRDFEDESREDRRKLQRQLDTMLPKILGGVAAIAGILATVFHFWH